MAELTLAPPHNGKQNILESLIHQSTDVGEILREDDSLLRMCFFQILHRHHPKIASKLNVIYALSASWGQDESSSDFEMLEKKLSELTPDEMILVSVAWKDNAQPPTSKFCTFYVRHSAKGPRAPNRRGGQVVNFFCGHELLRVLTSVHRLVNLAS